MKLVILAVLWAGAILFLPQQTGKPSNSDRNSQPQPSPSTENQPPLARPSPPQEKDGSDGKPDEPTFCERITKPLVDNWPVLAVAIWGILVARSTLKSIDRQAGLMEGQLKEMQGTGKQTEALIQRATEQTEAMRQQAVLMEGQLKEMQGAGTQMGQQIAVMRDQSDVMKASERAWISVKVENFPKPVEGEYAPFIWIDVTITNYGKTPAIINKIVIRPHLVGAEPPMPGHLSPIPQYPDDNQTVILEDRGMLITPGSPLKTVRVSIATDEYLNLIEPKKGTLYVYGFVDYRDTLEGKDHQTGFCEIYWISEMFDAESSGFTFSVIIPKAYFGAT